jgi:hypothetical protein
MTRTEAKTKAFELANEIKINQARQRKFNAIIEQLRHNAQGSETIRQAHKAAALCKRKADEAREKLESVKVFLQKDVFCDEVLQEIDKVLDDAATQDESEETQDMDISV